MFSHLFPAPNSEFEHLSCSLCPSGSQDEQGIIHWQRQQQPRQSNGQGPDLNRHRNQQKHERSRQIGLEVKLLEKPPDTAQCAVAVCTWRGAMRKNWKLKCSCTPMPGCDCILELFAIQTMKTGKEKNMLTMLVRLSKIFRKFPMPKKSTRFAPVASTQLQLQSFNRSRTVSHHSRILTNKSRLPQVS